MVRKGGGLKPDTELEAESRTAGAGVCSLLARGTVTVADPGMGFFGGGSSLRSAHSASSLALLASCPSPSLNRGPRAAVLATLSGAAFFRRAHTSARRCTSSLSRSTSRAASACTYGFDAGKLYGNVGGVVGSAFTFAPESASEACGGASSPSLKAIPPLRDARDLRDQQRRIPITARLHRVD